MMNPLRTKRRFWYTRERSLIAVSERSKAQRPYSRVPGVFQSGLVLHGQKAAVGVVNSQLLRPSWLNGVRK